MPLLNKGEEKNMSSGNRLSQLARAISRKEIPDNLMQKFTPMEIRSIVRPLINYHKIGGGKRPRSEEKKELHIPSIPSSQVAFSPVPSPPADIHQDVIIPEDYELPSPPPLPPLEPAGGQGNLFPMSEAGNAGIRPIFFPAQSSNLEKKSKSGTGWSEIKKRYDPLLEQFQTYSDDDVERVHDFVQILFPTDSQSQAQPGAPYLSPEDMARMYQDKKFKSSAKQALEKMLAFYGLAYNPDNMQMERLKDREENYKKYFVRGGSGQHNWMRLTRILRFLELMCWDEEKCALANQLQEMQKEIPVELDKRYKNSLRFWKDFIDRCKSKQRMYYCPKN